MRTPTPDGVSPVEAALGRCLPRLGWPAGYAWLITEHKLQVPAPPRLAAIAAGQQADEKKDGQDGGAAHAATMAPRAIRIIVFGLRMRPS